MTISKDEAQWHVENTFKDHEHNFGLAHDVLWDIDEVCIALDKLGWKIVTQDNDGRRWPMSASSPHCPAWAQSAEEQAEETRQEQCGEKPPKRFVLNKNYQSDWQRQRFKIVEPVKNDPPNEPA
jgi:hypothetical protein